jgi:hypothetical protein
MSSHWGRGDQEEARANDGASKNIFLYLFLGVFNMDPIDISRCKHTTYNSSFSTLD